MPLESEIFQRRRPDFSRFEAAGLKKDGGEWRCSRVFMDGQFRADIRVDARGEVRGRVYDLDTGDEYLAVHIPSQSGAFVASVRQAYADVLRDLAQRCFTAHDFVADQSNRVAALIRERFGNPPEFPWQDDSSAVFREPRTRKWYGVIMRIGRGKLEPGKDGEVDVLNVKADAADVPALLKERGIFRCYHMNKKYWVTVALDDSLGDERVMELLEASHAFAARGTGKSSAALSDGVWIVPANYRYYDVEKGFAENPVHTWKQTARVRPGDLVYLYIGSPVSAIYCKCRVLETDIPCDYDDGAVRMSRVMRLAMLRRYGRELLPMVLMKKFGVRAVRSARRMPETLRREIDRLEAENPQEAPPAAKKQADRPSKTRRIK
ncbi:MmcQ/YjbR family DNA-binding protein [Pyramidobacter sp. C12-8]|uniref:MmcQ/YjbR family DNA-binding protein n=1 Tax=Pyramidobacter sp. C12-8 TaxID=1943580 RepID=UPI00098F9BA5|nr:MmcQ/YjbR family DNA-binding protein [Pyramidobacter sp. C12-8]OON90078.1 hypothetical protein B0D78_00360 [Pyramidobacter sp. C12-8]